MVAAGVPVSLAWAGCVRQRSCWGLGPLYPCWAQGWGQLGVPCMSCWAVARCGAGAVSQGRAVLLQPHTGPGKLSPCHCCPRRQGGDFSARGATRRSGAGRAPVLLSPSVFPTPGFGDAPHPALLLPHLGASTPSSLGTPWAVPLSQCLQGTVLFLPRLWQRQSSVLPNWEGKVCSCFCFFPMFIPRLSSPLAAAMECPWSSQVTSQTWLLPLACSSTGSPCFPAFPQQLLPWKSQAIPAWARRAGVLLVELLGSISRGWGRQDVPPGRNPARPRHLHHFHFLSQPKLEDFGVGVACVKGCPWEGGTVSSHALGVVRASPGPGLPSPPQAPEIWLGCTERL